jgi:ABC-2 type transport system ATP-binding protein
VHRFVGFLPDFFGLYENMTAEEYLSYFCRCYGIRGAKIDERVDALLEVVSLSHKKKEVLDNLSRGMKQRIAIARSLVSDPPLLILDEPAAGLDPEARSELQRLFQKLAADGKTLIVSSHILSELQEYSTHVAILQRGALMAWGPTRELATAGDREESHRIRIRLLNETADYTTKLSRLDARLTALESTPASLLFRFQGKLSEVPAFIKKLSNEDLPLLSVGVEEEDMQDVYLKYMKGSQND